jgi:hypothetical protein
MMRGTTHVEQTWTRNNNRTFVEREQGEISSQGKIDAETKSADMGTTCSVNKDREAGVLTSEQGRRGPEVESCHVQRGLGRHS